MCSLVWLALLQKAWESDTRLVTAGRQDLAESQRGELTGGYQAHAAALSAGSRGEQLSQPVLLAEEFISLLHPSRSDPDPPADPGSQQCICAAAILGPKSIP